MNDKIVFILYVRKKQNIGSVMLTDSTGFYALRSMEWNSINGDERRELSGKVIYDAYSRFSILSSTPIPDWQFGRAFQLLIPSKIIYGNPSSSDGVVFIDRDDGFQFNIRTFNYKYADPNRGRFQDNIYTIDNNINYPDIESPIQVAEGIVYPLTYPKGSSLLINELERIGIDKDTLVKMDKDDELETFLRKVFWDKKHGR